MVLKGREYDVGCVWEYLVFSHEGKGRTWFSAPSSERNHPAWHSVIPYCKDDLEVKDSADESSPSNSEGPSTSKTKVESRLCHCLTITYLMFVIYVAFGESLCERALGEQTGEEQVYSACVHEK